MALQMHSTMTNRADSNIALQLQGVSRTYGSGRTAVEALRDVDLTVEPGEFVAVMGPSGSGKSTLLHVIGGMDRPTAGTVSVAGVGLDGLTVTAIAQHRRRAIGYVFQELNLVAGLTAVENVALPLELDGEKPHRAQEMAAAALEELGLGEMAERFPDDLSGGEQQRVAVARAMIGERRVILADEPTGALDSLNGEAVLRLLKAQADRGTAIVMVTHTAAQAAWADRIVTMSDGRVVGQAGPRSGPEAWEAIPVYDTGEAEGEGDPGAGPDRRLRHGDDLRADVAPPHDDHIARGTHGEAPGGTA